MSIERKQTYDPNGKSIDNAWEDQDDINLLTQKNILLQIRLVILSNNLFVEKSSYYSLFMVFFTK